MSLALTIFLVVILTVVVLGFLLPDKVHIERTTIIDAPADQIFSHISDFHEWPKWSPWYKLDPDANYEIAGSGVGHSMTWTSKEQSVGSGSQKIIELEAPNTMVTQLNFGEMGGGKATFLLVPAGESTKVTWSLDTNMRDGVPVLRQPIATFMGFFMEKFMDKPYTEGLADLKKLSEAS